MDLEDNMDQDLAATATTTTITDSPAKADEAGHHNHTWATARRYSSLTASLQHWHL
jgi:hypothetical protein